MPPWIICFWACYNWEYSRLLIKVLVLVNQPSGVGQCGGGKKPCVLNACPLLQEHDALVALSWQGSAVSHCCKVCVLTAQLSARPREKEQVSKKPKGPWTPCQCRIHTRHAHVYSLPWLLEEWGWNGGLWHRGSVTLAFCLAPPQHRVPECDGIYGISLLFCNKHI